MPKSPQKKSKGLSDEELIQKYEAGKIDLKKEIKKHITPKKDKKA
jgi:hypothetical protein